MPFRNIQCTSSGDNGTVVWPPSSGNLILNATLQLGTGNSFAGLLQLKSDSHNFGFILSGAGTLTGSRILTCPDASGVIVVSTADQVVFTTSGPTALTLPTSGTLATTATTSAYTAQTSTYAILATDCTVDCTSGSFTVTLPTAVGATGKIYNIKNSGAGTITVATTSAQTVDGATPPTLTAGVNLTVQSTGANWIIL